MQDTGDTQFLIPERNFAQFEKTIERLSKKCLKHTGEEISIVVFGYEMVEQPSGAYVKCFNVLMNTPKLVTGNWQFVATLDHSVNPEIGNVVTSLTNTSVPAQYRESHKCDHCSVNRFRNKTFLLSETTSGEYKQVGSSCLQDFTKIDSVAAVAKAAELIAQARAHGVAYSNHDSTSDKIIDGISLRQYMATVAMIITSEEQFVSVSESRRTGVPCTASLAMAAFFEAELKPQHYQAADAIIEWAQSIDVDNPLGQNNYLHNINLIARTPVIPLRAIYLAASMFAKRVVSMNPSKHLGSIGGVITAQVTVIERMDMDGMYGPYVIIRARDADSNMVSFTRPRTDLRVGDRIQVTGTVSALDEYHGNRTTRLNKIKIGQPNA